MRLVDDPISEYLPPRVWRYLARNPGFFDGREPVFFLYSKGVTMAADSKHQLTIIAYKVIDYRNKKTGAAEQMKLAQCVIRSKSEEKGEQTLVGELVMPKALHDTPPGDYLAEFELAVGQDLRVGSRLSKLVPLRAAVPARPATAGA